MQYKEYRFYLNEITEVTADIYFPLLCEELAQQGFDSFEELPDGLLLAYLPERSFGVMDEKGLFTLSFLDLSFAYESSLCAQENWNKKWEEEGFTPMEIDNKVLIRAPYHTHSVSTVEQEIIIEPACAFGTGSHCTTRLMIRLLLERQLQYKNVLDVGCGTGVLGITSLLQGAKEVYFIDIDSQATQNTEHNLTLNAIPPLAKSHIYTGILEDFDLPQKHFDLICANIHRNIILHDASRYHSLLHDTGNLLISGFLEEDVPVLKEKLAVLGFTTNKILSEEGWCAISLSIAQK